MLSMIDVGIGNLRSVTNAFSRAGAEIERISRPQEIADAKVLILPGVGAFETAMDRMRQNSLIEPILHFAKIERRPIIGICLGMQLLGRVSEENGEHEGLGLIDGRVTRLRPGSVDYRVPNIGWHAVSGRGGNPLFPDEGPGGTFYFVHSYHLKCAQPVDSVATITYGAEEVTVAVAKDNVFGVQFHPEKSQDDGLDLLSRFLDYARQSVTTA